MNIPHEYIFKVKLKKKIRQEFVFYFLPIAIFLGSKIYEIGSHRKPLTIPEFCHTQSCGHVLICHFISYTPSHVHNLRKINLQPYSKYTLYNYLQLIHFEKSTKDEELPEIRDHVFPYNTLESLDRPIPSKCFFPSTCL